MKNYTIRKWNLFDSKMAFFKIDVFQKTTRVLCKQKQYLRNRLFERKLYYQFQLYSCACFIAAIEFGGLSYNLLLVKKNIYKCII